MNIRGSKLHAIGVPVVKRSEWIFLLLVVATVIFISVVPMADDPETAFNEIRHSGQPNYSCCSMDEICASDQCSDPSSEIIQPHGRRDSHVGGIDITPNALAFKPAA